MARYTMPRSSYIPPQVREPLRPEGTDLEIWAWESESDGVCAVAFQGKASKPLWNYGFMSLQSREECIEKTVTSRRASLVQKAQERAARSAYTHDVKVGDFFVTSWGYDQTNVDFYEVVGVPSSKSVTLRKVANKHIKEARTCCNVVPSPGAYTDKPFTKRVGKYGVKLDYRHASKWDGKPKYETAWGYGH